MIGKHHRVLLVDDYPDALEIWSMYLQLCGYEVLTAEDGKKAVDLAVSVHPDIIVMDLELPGITGFEAARRLRARPDTEQIPMIAATGYSHAHQLDEAQESGFDLIMIKPCDPSVLASEIEKLLADPEPTTDGMQPDAHFQQSVARPH